MTRAASMGRRLWAFALLPLLVLGAVAHAAALYRCRMDGVVRQSCCCPKDDAAEAAPRQGFERANCCAVEPAQPAQPPTTSPPSQPDAPLAVPTLWATSTGVPSPVAASLATTARPSGLGPPILALKSCRLI